VLIATTLPPRIEQPSDWVLWVLFIVVAVPATLIPQYSFVLTHGRALTLGLLVIGTFLALSLLSRYGPFPGRLQLRIPLAVLWPSIAAFSVITYALVSATYGLSIVGFSLDNVREIRLGYRAESTGGGILGYLIRYQGSVINPFLIAAGLLRRRWALVAAGILGQILLFGATGYKLFFFSVPVVLALVWALRGRRTIAGQTALAGAVVAALAAIVADKIRGGPIYWIEIFIDRMMIVPGMLTAAYVWVYHDRPKHQWVYAGLNPFGHDPYHGSPPGIIVGEVFSGSAASNANANFLADGYANLGYLGLLIEALLVVATLWGVNATGKHLPMAIVAPILLLPALTLANGSSFIALLTGGFFFAMLLMAVLPAEGWDRGSEPGPAKVSVRSGTTGTPRRG
jgi:hypothetical protein